MKSTLLRKKRAKASRRLLAVDPSLTCSGWALFDLSDELAGGALLVAVGKIRSLAASVPLASRLFDLQQKICSVFDQLSLGSDDVLICESQTTMRDPRAAFKVEQVRGIFETIARSRELKVPGRINPRSVQSEVMGLRGRQLERSMVKQTAVQIVKTVYGEALTSLGFTVDSKNLQRHQDIVDAILVGSLAVTRVQGAERCGFELEDAFAPKIRRVGKRLPR